MTDIRTPGLLRRIRTPAMTDGMVSCRRIPLQLSCTPLMHPDFLKHTYAICAPDSWHHTSLAYVLRLFLPLCLE